MRKSEVAQIGFSPNLRFVHPCPVVDLPARPPAPTPSRWTLPVLIGFVGVALAVLLVVPILLDAQIDALRAEINGGVREATERTVELEREAALAAAASRGFLASGDTLFVSEYRDAEKAVTHTLAALDTLAVLVGPAVPEIVDRVQEAWAIWNAPVQRMLTGATERAVSLEDLPLSQARYQVFFSNILALDDAVQTAYQARRARILALDRTQRRVLLALIPLALLAAAAVYGLGRGLHRQAADLERRVEARTREVRRLSAALVETQRREQARIAQLLHDHLQQLLYGARMRLRSVSDAAPDDVQAVDTILVNAIQATRTLAAELAPPVLREEGLGAALCWLSGHIEEVHGLRVAAEVDEGVPVVPRHVQDLLFQLARELLFNVVKHAGVDEAALALRTRDETLILTVVDEGRGFDAASTEYGYGLSSARERVALVEGDFRVESAEGRGTRVTVRVPLREPGVSELARPVPAP